MPTCNCVLRACMCMYAQLLVGKVQHAQATTVSSIYTLDKGFSNVALVSTCAGLKQAK